MENDELKYRIRLERKGGFACSDYVKTIEYNLEPGDKIYIIEDTVHVTEIDFTESFRPTLVIKKPSKE